MGKLRSKAALAAIAILCALLVCFSVVSIASLAHCHSCWAEKALCRECALISVLSSFKAAFFKLSCMMLPIIYFLAAFSIFPSLFQDRSLISLKSRINC